MLPKKYRLSTKEIKIFFNKEPKKKIIDHLKIYYEKNNLNFPKFAVICKKDLFKKAIIRNKIKRRIQAIIKEIIKEKQIDNFNFIIIPEKKEFETEKFYKFKKTIKRALLNQ
jgi:ribonuclease P protein component